MKQFKDVHGSLESSKELIIGKTTVYVHSNVREVKIKDDILKEERTEYVYDEIQYDKDEFIATLSNENKSLKNDVDNLNVSLAEMLGI